MSIFVDEQVCNGCGKAPMPFCVMVCPGDLMYLKPNRKADITELSDCWDCAACVKHCPVGAIEMRLPMEVSETGTALRAKAMKVKTRWSLSYPDGTHEQLDVPIADTKDPEITVTEGDES